MHEPPGCLKIDFKHVDPQALPTTSTSMRRSHSLPTTQKWLLPPPGASTHERLSQFEVTQRVPVAVAGKTTKCYFVVSFCSFRNAIAKSKCYASSFQVY